MKSLNKGASPLRFAATIAAGILLLTTALIIISVISSPSQETAEGIAQLYAFLTNAFVWSIPASLLFQWIRNGR